MTADCKTQMSQIFVQLRQLRESVTQLATSERHRVQELRGAQTPDTDEAIELSFATLQDQIAAMEETLATLAEATGDIPKLT
jgi:transposase